MHSNFYLKVQVWLKANDGVKSWTTIAQQLTTYFFFVVFVQPIGY
jgi:hypothetical protein